MTQTLAAVPGTTPRLQVDIWSDIACPWCYVGKRRFEAALEQFPHRGQVDTVWHSFELDPAAPLTTTDGTAEILARKYGRTPAQAQEMLDSMTQTAAQDGLEYHFGAQRPTNTFQAHQLIHLAREHGLQGAMKERLLRAFFTEGAFLGDPEVLARLAAEVGLDPEEVRTALAEQTHAAAVRDDEETARSHGISGVPFFVLGGKYGVSGAQSPETLLGALNQLWSEAAPLTLIGAATSSDGCEDGSCAVPQS
ncbi:DsbA family oxidoreductase [Deinococcus sp.]|uniref:DsbA family oxidoreductase n=1 Tax=Deinococcus sp. TaxID=47478 RepID=UPI0025D64D0D|nr:DsbA family oxidoreductase [Deinococcus sp.]